MNQALLGVLILLGVAVFVAVQVWGLRRWSGRLLDAAAADTSSNADTAAEGAITHEYTRHQTRLFIGSIVLSWVLFVAGAVLAGVDKWPGLSMALVIAAVVLVETRVVARLIMRRAARRVQRAIVGEDNAG